MNKDMPTGVEVTGWQHLIRKLVVRGQPKLKIWLPSSLLWLPSSCYHSIQCSKLRVHFGCRVHTIFSCAHVVCMLFGGETSRIGELFIDVSPPFLRVEIQWGVL